MEGNRQQSRVPGHAETHVRQRLSEIDVHLPTVDPTKGRLSDVETVQLFAAMLAQLTALREIVTLLAAEIDALGHQPASPD